MADPFIGQELGGYRITRLLKRTGMSMIYLGWDAKLQREVVVKIMLPVHSGDESFAARFQQEALATARLAHPNIVHIYDFGQREDLLYMVMEYLPGGSLHDRLVAAAREGRRLDPTQSVIIIRQVALALDHAHQAGIIHRDVKPSNILFARDGRPVLTDLGIARAHEGPRLTKTMTAVGTPEYMSPEQGRGDPVDGRSDIYSLGVVLYELLAGVLPFQADTAWGLIFKHMQEPPPPLEAKSTGVSPAMRSVVEKALAKRPEDRFQTAQEMADAIRRALETPNRWLYATPPPVTLPSSRVTSAWAPPVPRKVEEEPTRLIGTGEAPEPPPAPAPRPRRRGAGLWFAGAGAVVLSVALLFVFNGVLRPRPTPAPTFKMTATLVRPTVTLAPTATGVPPTATALPPTATRVPTATPVPPTATGVPPTATPVPLTATRMPTATAVPPTATRVPPTATALPPTATRMPTATPVPPTATRPPATARPSATPVGVSNAPVLLSPADNEARSGQVTFTWRWDGPALAANQGFELRVWKEGQPDHYGAASPTQATSITIDIRGAFGVRQGGSGRYFWTVGLVQLDPYLPIGKEAAPRLLEVQTTSTPFCEGPGCDDLP